jgi:hypothetical protein
MTLKRLLVSFVAVVVGVLAGFVIRKRPLTAQEKTSAAVCKDQKQAARKLRAARPAPKLAVRPPGGLMSTNVRQPGYSSINLIMADVKAWDIYDSEPRSAEWAPIMEQMIRTQVAKDMTVMVPGTQITAMSCKSTICRLDLELPGDKDPAALMQALQFAPMGDAQSFQGFDELGPDGKWHGTFYQAFDKNRDPATQAALNREHRRSYLEKLKPGVGRFSRLGTLPPE